MVVFFFFLCGPAMTCRLTPAIGSGNAPVTLSAVEYDSTENGWRDIFTPLLPCCPTMSTKVDSSSGEPSSSYPLLQLDQTPRVAVLSSEALKRCPNNKRSEIDLRACDGVRRQENTFPRHPLLPRRKYLKRFATKSQSDTLARSVQEPLHLRRSDAAKFSFKRQVFSLCTALQCHDVHSLSLSLCAVLACPQCTCWDSILIHRFRIFFEYGGKEASSNVKCVSCCALFPEAAVTQHSKKARTVADSTSTALQLSTHLSRADAISRTCLRNKATRKTNLGIR